MLGIITAFAVLPSKVRMGLSAVLQGPFKPLGTVCAVHPTLLFSLCPDLPERLKRSVLASVDEESRAREEHVGLLARAVATPSSFGRRCARLARG